MKLELYTFLLVMTKLNQIEIDMFILICYINFKNNNHYHF